METKIKNILIRYFLIALLSLNGLYLFYIVFTPLTIYPIYLFYKVFYNATLSGSTIIFPFKAHIEIVFSCIAGSAYFLLFALNIAIPSIKLNKRLRMMAFAFGVFLLINIIRIIFLGELFLARSSLYEISHLIFWYFLSTIFIVCIWFAEIKIFKIKQIPFYTDIKYIISKIK